MDDERKETELRALMHAYAALGFIAQVEVFPVWLDHNDRVTQTVYDAGEIPRGPTRAEIRQAIEVIFGMILARGDDALIAEAVERVRPERREHVREALEADMKRLRP